MIQSSPITLLVGAGISVEHPSNLPLAVRLRDNILKELIADLPNSYYTKLALEAISKSDFTLEFLLEVLSSRFGESALSCLHHLSSTSPNICHKSISHLAAQGKLYAIITLNLDELIEKALEDVGLNPNYDYNRILGIPPLPLKVYPLPLVKLHGTISNISSLKVTLRQVGHSRKFKQEVDKLFYDCTKKSNFVVSGYRGADSDLHAALIKMIANGRGIWNTIDTEGIHSPIYEKLKLFSSSWSIDVNEATKYFTKYLPEHGNDLLPSERNIPKKSVSWSAGYDPTLIYKSVTDILAHIGQYNLMIGLSTEALHNNPSDKLPLLFSLIEGQLARDQINDSYETLKIIDEQLEFNNIPIERSFVKYKVERNLVASKYFWQNGEHDISINLLDQMLIDIKSRKLKITQHQKVRLLCYIAERIIFKGNYDRAIELCKIAQEEAGGHIQLNAVARRTLGLCNFHLGNYEYAKVLVCNALPDLIADINGKIIANIILAKIALATKNISKAHNIIDKCRKLVNKTDHKIRKGEISKLDNQICQ